MTDAHLIRVRKRKLLKRPAIISPEQLIHFWNTVVLV